MFGKLIDAWKGYDKLRHSVLSLYQEGVDIKQIADQLGLAIDVVKFIVGKAKENRS